MKKHIYEDGFNVFPMEKMTQYSKLLQPVLASYFENIVDDDEKNKLMTKQHHYICDVTRKIIYRYTITESFSHVEDCETIEEWEKKKVDCEITNVVKQIFIDFKNDGWELQELNLIMWHIVCQTHINILGFYL